MKKGQTKKNPSKQEAPGACTFKFSQECFEILHQQKNMTRFIEDLVLGTKKKK
jgi:hypothetical protein